MHILFLSHYYPPEVNAPASRTAEHCRQWVKAGHDVTVVTCAPNHPAGKLYDGYRNRLFQRETLDGVEVIRVWTYLAANAGFLRRTLNYLSYVLGVTLALPRLKAARRRCLDFPAILLWPHRSHRTDVAARALGS